MMDNVKMNKWKSGYISVLNIITIVAIVLGSIIHIGGFIGKGIVKGITGGWGENVQTVASGSEVEAFDDISADLSVGGFTVQSGDKYSVSYTGYPAGSEPKMVVKNKTLVISQKTKGNLNLIGGNHFSECGVTVTVPEGCVPDIDLDVDMGAFEAKDIKLGDVSIDADMGGITLKNCEIGDLDIQADMGGIEIDGGSFGDGSFNADAGGIVIKDVSFDEASCEAALGGVEVSGDYRELSADCDMGSIEVSSDDPGTEFDLECDMGSVKVNGKDMGSKYSN